MCWHGCMHFMLNLTILPPPQTRSRDESNKLLSILEQILDRLPQLAARPADPSPATNVSLQESFSATAQTEPCKSSREQANATDPASERNTTAPHGGHAGELPTAPVSRTRWLEQAAAVATAEAVALPSKNDDESTKAAAKALVVSTDAAGEVNYDQARCNGGSGFNYEARHVSVPPGMAFLIDPDPVTSKMRQVSSPHPSLSASLKGTPSRPKPGAIGRNPGSVRIDSQSPESPAAASLSRRSTQPEPAPATLSSAQPHWREPWAIGESPASKASRSKVGAGAGSNGSFMPESLESWLVATMGGLGLVSPNRALPRPGGNGCGSSST